MKRTEEVEKLVTVAYDVCVIGAGASGAGVALDAALRGLKVCLVDRGDFVSETSSKSTKLIHGGVRYLEQAFKNLDFGQLKQVQHGLTERRYLLTNGAHLTRPLGILTPVFSWFEGLYYTIGLKIYGWFAKNDKLPSASWLSKEKTLQSSSNLTKKLHSSVLYYDGQIDDARYALAIVQTAYQAGANTVNYVQIDDFEKDQNGKIIKAVGKDVLSGNSVTIEAKIFINCTGPFADNLRLKANSTELVRISASKGVHIIVPIHYFDSVNAMLIPKTKDGRVVFVIPFKTHVMIGTTDTPYKRLNEEPLLESSEVDFLLESIEEFLDKKPSKSEITAGFGGLRPLISSKSRNPNETKTLLRDHEVEVDDHSGLISLLGGKWTTYRIMAQDTVDVICSILGDSSQSKTHNHSLVGSQESIPANDGFFDQDVYDSLIHSLGDKISEIVNICKKDSTKKSRLHPNHPYILAEVVYSVRNEMVQKPRDFMARRTRFELMDWKACLEAVPAVTNLIGEELGWDQAKIESENIEYQIHIKKFIETAFS
ncbi:MAG: glycerol-3-phosphate dehydrogenase/oxidase [Leadbetterella sp.]